MSIGHSYGCSSGSCVWVDWGFGDFQSLKTTPGEHPQQPIEPSHLGPGASEFVQQLDQNRALTFRQVGKGFLFSQQNLLGRLRDQARTLGRQAQLLRPLVVV